MRKKRSDVCDERRPIWQRMKDEYGRATLRCCRAEIMGCSRMTVQGCREILEYGRCCIRLSVCDPDVRELVVCGEELVCLSYHPDAIMIEGRIRAVSFCDDGKAVD